MLFWRGANAVGGGLTFGFFGGLIAATTYSIAGNGFHWSTVGKWVVVSTLFGLAIEIVCGIANRKKPDSN